MDEKYRSIRKMCIRDRMTPEKYKRGKLVFIGGEGTVIAGKLQADDSAPIKEMVVRKLTEAGFIVDGDTPAIKGKMEDLRKKYDACLVVFNVSGFAQYNTCLLYTSRCV